MAYGFTQDPFPPFDYGSLVTWRTPDGSIQYGSIFAFTDRRLPQSTDSTPDPDLIFASVELGDGSSVELPLSGLTICPDEIDLN